MITKVLLNLAIMVAIVVFVVGALLAFEVASEESRIKALTVTCVAMAVLVAILAVGGPS